MLPWLLETTVIASVLALIAALAGRSKRVGPSTRHALWLLVIVRLLLPPLWHWPVEWSWPRADPPVAIAAIEPDRALEVSGAEAPEIELVEMAENLAEIPSIETTTAADAPVVADLVLAYRPLIVPGVLGLWLLGSATWAGRLALQVFRFHKRLVDSSEPPDWLRSMLKEVGGLLNVEPPAVQVVADLETPLLWCLGRPRLLVPSKLLSSLDPEAWRGILAHELAHLRRGDPWFGRLLMAAGLVWWWHPLYRWARARVELEAEIACDAWVVAIRPEARHRYASTLVDVCESASFGRGLAPALGVVGGPGLLLERRLIMILRERVSPRTSPAGLLVVALLASVSIPSWTRAQDEPAKEQTVVKPPDEPKVEVRVLEPRVTVERKANAEPRDQKEAKARFEIRIEGLDGELHMLKDLPDQLIGELKAKQIELGKELEAKIKEALDKANLDPAIRSAIEEQLKTLRTKSLEIRTARIPQLSNAKAEVEKARDQLAAAEALLRAESARRAAETRKVETRARKLTPAEATPEGVKPDLERRMEKLESKVDSLLEEIKALRREASRQKGDQGK